MKKVIALMVLLIGISFFLNAAGTDAEKDKDAIKNVILSAYRDGICNVGDVAAIKKGFHPEFALLGLNKDHSALWKLPIDKWAKGVEKNKADGKYPPAEKISFKFLNVDITGAAAMVKLEFSRGEKLAYTDYLLLYKFKDGWKLVSKIYNEH